MRRSFLIVLLLAGGSALAQESGSAAPRENQLQADFRRESEHIKESCGTFSFKTFFGCAEELATDHPLHLALGSIAPQNGFGFGLAFVTHYTPNESWRLSWDFDAVGATSGSWRAGGYMKLIHTPVQHIIVVTNPTGKPAKSNLAVHPYTVFNIYAQAISLNQLSFFGVGPSTLESGKTVFGMQHTIIGANVIKPVTEWPAIRSLNLSLLGEVNGRFVNLRGNHGASTPSIEQVYTNASAPGLATQPGFVQLGEGIRLKPVLFNDHLQFNYLVNFQQFFAPSDSTYSFRRWTVDLDHEVPLYGHSQSVKPKDTNGPDECAQAVGAEKCPPVSYSRNRNGTIGMRLLISESMASAGSVVPFYFQPTLGGSDINGSPALSSYADYRFRGPNLLLLRESFEHSLWGPLGFTFMADQGKVALTRGDVDFQNLKHSFATGITLRAGGFPQVFLLFAWGGNEGHHTIATVNTALLGGSSRPSLY
ncbi:MAG TPA: hypothetical protein VN948_19005 [Terriglobales bacterium]|nr:hypothetical protein [Terriglobales bacterium]